MVRRSLFAASLFVCLGAYAQKADLSVTLNGPSTVVANYDTATPTVTFSITNAGPATVTDATVDFSPGLVVNLPNFTCATVTDHVRCTTSSFPPSTVQGSGSMDVQQPGDQTLVTITAAVSSATIPDPTPSNNTATAYEWIRWKSNVSLTGITMPATLPVPQPWSSASVDARINFKIDGPSYATDVTISISKPPYTSFRGTSDPAITCVTPPTPPYATSESLVCTAKKLGATNQGFVDISFPIGWVSAGTTIFLTATMTCSDAVQQPLSATAGLRIVDPAFVMVTSVNSPDSVESGATFATNVGVQNAGPGTAVNAQVEFSVTGSPFALGLPTAPPGWVCDPTSTGVTCSINSFAPGYAYFAFPIVLAPDVPPGKLLQSIVASSVTDGYPPWRRGVMTWISPEKLPSFTQTIDGPSTVYLGSTATYTITATNTSVNEATNPVLELTTGSASKVTWNCPDPQGDRRCGLGDMPPGSSRTIYATLPVVADYNSTSMSVQTYVVPADPDASYYYPPAAPSNFMRSTIEPAPPKRRSTHH